MDKRYREIAVSFLQLASSGKVREAYEKYIHPDFSHHNPYFKGDRQSLLKGMQESAVQFPHKEFEAIRALADGEIWWQSMAGLGWNLTCRGLSSSISFASRMTRSLRSGKQPRKCQKIRPMRTGFFDRSSKKFTFLENKP
jgi:hypothetical protein